MLRIHFTAADLSLLTVSNTVDPMWEVVASTFRLRRPEGGRIFGRWREGLRGALPAAARKLLDVVPPYGYVPDFFTPADSGTTLDDGIDVLSRTPVETVRTDLRELARGHRVPKWLAGAAWGQSQGLRELGGAVHAYHRACIEPHWKHISSAVKHDSARRTRVLEEHGPHQLLSTLHPAVRWRPPVLEVQFPVEQDLHLDGRGLRLVSSFFCMGMPTTYKDPALQPTLVYSIDHFALPDDECKWASTKAGDAALAALLGETRARVLRAIAADSCSTTELARRTGTSPATASEHASVLRNAGLIKRRQSGRSTMHIATALGKDLLLGGHQEFWEAASHPEPAMATDEDCKTSGPVDA